MNRLHRDERGTVTLWMLGLGLLLLTLGGISLDLWRLISERRELAVMADAAAVAAVNAVDVVTFRQSGVVTLDGGEAQSLAEQSLASQPVGDEVILRPDWFELDADGITVVIRLRREVEFTLLRIAGAEPVEIGAAGRAIADLRP